jgi:hypothetical protein
MIKQNIGTIDGWIRVIAGLTVIAVGILIGSWWGALGLVLLVTAIAGRCPFYSLAGISTIKKSSRSTDVARAN